MLKGFLRYAGTDVLITALQLQGNYRFLQLSTLAFSRNLLHLFVLKFSDKN